LIIKKHKIFETGNYPQGDFPMGAVSEIFANTSEGVTGHFAHSSKYEGDEAKLDLGTFSNFELDEAGIITADIDLNDKGTQYFEDGILSGVSVEIAGGEISSVALLPKGVAPAIAGAEFEDKGAITFGGTYEFAKEEEKKEPVEFNAQNIVDQIRALEVQGEEFSALYAIEDAIWDKTNEKSRVDSLEALGYTVTAPTNEFAEVDFTSMSSAQIVEFMNKTTEKKITEAKAKEKREFEAKSAGQAMFDKLKGDGKITGAMEEAGVTAEFMSALHYQKTQTIEFEETSINVESIIAVFEALPTFASTQQTKREFDKKSANKGKYDDLSVGERAYFEALDRQGIAHEKN
jgi:hypothetical protein